MYIIISIVEFWLQIYRGSNFRSSFAELGGLRALTNVQFLALTASAPPEIDFIVQSQDLQL